MSVVNFHYHASFISIFLLVLIFHVRFNSVFQLNATSVPVDLRAHAVDLMLHISFATKANSRLMVESADIVKVLACLASTFEAAQNDGSQFIPQVNNSFYFCITEKRIQNLVIFKTEQDSSSLLFIFSVLYIFLKRVSFALCLFKKISFLKYAFMLLIF